MPVPERIGRLRRVEWLGAGGFATVWRYHDEELASDVAVKVLAENWAMHGDVRRRFLEEARYLRLADSDHVVRVYDVGELEGTPYFVMSYADRGSVDTLLQPGLPLPAARVAHLVAQAGDGLSVLHQRGIVHRDVKPQNLLLRTDDAAPAAPDGVGERLLVADLGVAKELLLASGLTQTVGTPAYMAPEQAANEGVDVRADVHALGAVAYHLLTGRLMREGGFDDLARGVLPAPPSAYADVSGAVDAALMGAVHPDRDRRWPDVASFVDAFGRAIAGDDGPGSLPPRPAPVAAPGAAPAAAPVPVPDAEANAVPDGSRGSRAPATSSRVVVLWSLLVLVLSAAVAFGVAALLINR